MRRRFMLIDPATGESVPGEVGLDGGEVLTADADGVIAADIESLPPSQVEELERYAATPGHPVVESEPADDEPDDKE